MDAPGEVALPCGHQCLVEDLGVGVLTCPVCSVTHSVDLLDTKLLPPDLDLQESRPCPVHGDPIRMWCKDCMEPACGLCGFDNHPVQEHRVVRVTTYISGIRKDLLANSHRMLRQTSQGMVKNDAALQEYEGKLLEALEESKALHQLHGELRALIPEVESATGIRPLHRAEMALKRIQAKAWTVPAIHQSNLSHEGDADASCSEDLLSVRQPPGVRVGNATGRRARLRWDADRLLLCAMSGASPHPQPVLQLVAVDSLGAAAFPEVFLELSVDTEPLGIVYIKLWGHLRRAQNFMLLCLGTFGPSFVGSHLLPGTTPTESVGAGMYRDARGEMSALPLLTALEWGGQYQTPLSKGLLVATSTNQKSTKGPRRAEVDCLYAIITGDGAEGGISPCKFGWVSSGLQHVREATLHEAAGQVWISECGLVLPRRS
ncbi:hypothetical protein GWK47_013461 [Chionoecetes opilio]|uniref:B box-type domain-containing protein n=1 Tax=Chionoecetes opilio TaxID=41210 RepID=A0A8J5CLG4_CHIOP|nr:hypothetical protein GWK47_013461 [Chionoecetes opilio]